MIVSDLIKRVKVKMEELTPFGEGLAVTNPSLGSPIPVTSGVVLLRPETYQKPIETYIKESIKDAYYTLISFCPYHLLPTASFIGIIITVNTDGSGYFTLPVDYYKLKEFQLNQWERPAFATIDEDNPAYRAQFNKWARGNESKPICAISGDKTKMELYSVSKGVMTFKKGSYVPKLTLTLTPQGNIQDNGTLNLEESFVLPLVYVIASKVYDIYGQPDLSKIMLQNAMQLCQ